MLDLTTSAVGKGRAFRIHFLLVIFDLCFAARGAQHIASRRGGRDHLHHRHS